MTRLKNEGLVLHPEQLGTKIRFTELAQQFPGFNDVSIYRVGKRINTKAVMNVLAEIQQGPYREKFPHSVRVDLSAKPIKETLAEMYSSLLASKGLSRDPYQADYDELYWWFIKSAREGASYAGSVVYLEGAIEYFSRFHGWKDALISSDLEKIRRVLNLSPLLSVNRWNRTPNLVIVDKDTSGFLSGYGLSEDNPGIVKHYIDRL